MNWNQIKQAKWFLPLAVGLMVIFLYYGVGAYSSWQTSQLTAVGEISIAVSTNASYTLSTSTVEFGFHSYPGSAIALNSEILYISNDGNEPINSINVTVSPKGSEAFPAWLSVTVPLGAPIMPGINNVPIQLVLSGTVPANWTASIDLSQFNYNITPQ
jgi:hypothetical protein